MLRAAQSAIVHPERSEGAYAVDGFLRRSHFKVSGSAVDLPVAGTSVFRVMLFGYQGAMDIRCIGLPGNAPQEPCVIQHDTDRPATLDVFLAVSPMQQNTFRGRKEGEPTPWPGNNDESDVKHADYWNAYDGLRSLSLNSICRHLYSCVSNNQRSLR